MVMIRMDIMSEQLNPSSSSSIASLYPSTSSSNSTRSSRDHNNYNNNHNNNRSSSNGSSHHNNGSHHSSSSNSNCGDNSCGAKSHQKNHHHHNKKQEQQRLLHHEPHRYHNISKKRQQQLKRSGSQRLHLEIPMVVVNPASINARRHLKWKKNCQIRLVVLVLATFFFFSMVRLTNLRVFMQGFAMNGSVGAYYDIDLKLIPGRYSYVQGIQDLNTDSVEVWCQDASLSEEECYKQCGDPLVARGRGSISRWSRLHQKNVENANGFERGECDVAFLGDSITEGWTGTLLENRVDHVLGDSHLVFQKHFSIRDSSNNNHNENENEENEEDNNNDNDAADAEGVAKYQGIALGISGDTAPNLLYRLQDGELSDNLQPSVFWLLIGTNDLAFSGCSPEIALIGILRVVEELLEKRPQSTVVINGLLPRTKDKDGYVNVNNNNIPHHKTTTIVENPSHQQARTTKTKTTGGRSSPPPATTRTLWEEITAVNRELQKYALRRENVEYFETSVFFEDPTVHESELRIDTGLMRDKMHPHADGYELWAQEIEQTLERIITVR